MDQASELEAVESCIKQAVMWARQPSPGSGVVVVEVQACASLSLAWSQIAMARLAVAQARPDFHVVAEQQ